MRFVVLQFTTKELHCTDFACMYRGFCYAIDYLHSTQTKSIIKMWNSVVYKWPLRHLGYAAIYEIP